MHTALRTLRQISVLSLLAACTLPAVAADSRVYVVFAHGQKANAQAALKQAGAKSHHEFDDLDAIAASMPEGKRAALARNPAITLIEEDPVRDFLSQQTVPYGITMVQAPQAIAAGATGAGIKVGVIDSGVSITHEDLQSVAIAGEPDFGPNDQRTWYRDIDSHGTHVVGTLTAANNSLGVVGVSGGDISIYMVKVFGDTGNWVYSSDLLAAARAAQAHGARIISMSLGGGRSSQIEKQGLTDLYNNKNVLLIAAAGNDGTTGVSYPAGYPTVVSVAAIDSNKVVADFSQKNSDVELAAPGVAVLSTVSYVDTSTVDAGGSLGTTSGTHIEFAARGTATAALVNGGLGDTTNAAWSGKVVFVDRGTISFYDKVHNVQLSGGLACVIANNDTAAPDDGLNATLGDGNSSTIPAIGISYNAGQALHAAFGNTVTLTSTLQQPASGYAFFDGTSMATPHVSGVAALIWSKYPGATNVQVRTALTNSAEDLGTAGRDNSYGYGLVRAKAALDALAALNPGGGGDTVAPVISSVTAVVTNSKNGSFDITWTTNELSTSDVQLGSTMYPDPTLTTLHKRSFKGTKGATYIYSVFSSDAAGNTASAGPFTHNN